MPSAGGRVRLSAGPLAALHPHAEGVSNPLRSLLEEPRPSAPPVRVWRDWALLAAVTVSGVLEGVLREDLPLPGLSVVLTVGLAPLLLWRRTHPLAVVATAFGVAAVVDIGLIVADAPALEMHSMVYFLVFPYALFRWGSGREAAAGLAIILVAATLEFFVNWTGVAIGGGAVLMSAFALGLAVRSQHGARQRRWGRSSRRSGSCWRASCTTRWPTTSPPSPSRPKQGALSRRPAPRRRSRRWR